MALPSITWDDVLAIAPTLESTPAEARTAILAQVAAELVNEALTAADLALYAAHLATARTRFSVESAAGALDDTSYGREFRRRLETNPGLRFLAMTVC